MYKKLISIVILTTASNLSFAAEEHHNLKVSICRALPSGDLLIRGKSTDSNNRDIHFSEGSFGERIIDRYISLCLTAFSTKETLRIDYLNCNGLSCSPTGNTSLNLQK